MTREPRRDLRKGKRTPRRQAAWVVLDGGHSRISCVLWDMSEGGARIAAARTNALPDVFGLFLTKDGKSRRFCQVAWRRSGQVGVRFVEERVANIDLDPTPQWMRRKAVAASPAAGAAPSQNIEASELLLPGCGPHVALEGERRPLTTASIAFGMLMLLAAATVLFALARTQNDAHWAVTVCTNAQNFCQHPEWAGTAALAMFVVYLTVKGMER